MADLVLLPYDRFEAQSGVGATAVSFRKPLIVSDAGGLPDLVEDHRFVVPASDSTSLAHAVVRCLSDSELLGRMARDADLVARRTAWPAAARKDVSCV